MCPQTCLEVVGRLRSLAASNLNRAPRIRLLMCLTTPILYGKLSYLKGFCL